MQKISRVKVWDIVVRLFHWSLVILFLITYLSGEVESLLHIYSGYGVLGLLLFRVLWGFVGTKHARFTDFIYGPASTLKYVRSLFTSKPEHYLGHNPVGGWMAVLLIVSLLGVSWSGLELYGAEGYGPLASEQNFIIEPTLADEDEREDNHENEEDEGEEYWEEIHEALANITLFLVFVHIVGVLIASIIHRENLIKSMITGYKYIKNS